MLKTLRASLEHFVRSDFSNDLSLVKLNESISNDGFWSPWCMCVVYLIWSDLELKNFEQFRESERFTVRTNPKREHRWWSWISHRSWSKSSLNFHKVSTSLVNHTFLDNLNKSERNLNKFKESSLLSRRLGILNL